MSDDTFETESPCEDDPVDDLRFHERLRAVERALTGDDLPVADLTDDSTATAERDALDGRLSEIEDRVEELEAATQALRGYVGSIRAVNREVERRADLALATATDVRVDGMEDRHGDVASTTDPAVAAAVPDGRSNELEQGIDDLSETASDGDDVDRDVLARLREVL